MDLPAKLRTELALHGLRPVDLARRTGFDKGYISRILSGASTPPPATMTRIILAIHADHLDGRHRVAA